MRRKEKTTLFEASDAVATTTNAQTMPLNQHAAEVPPAALVAFAEELGRLLARRLLADLDCRRGYSLPESLLGAVTLVLLLLLAARGLGLLPR